MSWRRSVSLVLLLLLGCVVGGAQEKPVELTDDSHLISFVPPTGLHAMSEERVAAIRSKGAPAKFIFADANLDTMIVINTYGDDASEQELRKVKKRLEEKAKRENPRLVWLNREWIKINGARWARVRFKTGTGAEDTVDDIYVIDTAGKFVMFNFKSRASKFESNKDALERSARTIQLGIMVNVPVQEATPAATTTAKPQP